MKGGVVSSFFSLCLGAWRSTLRPGAYVPGEKAQPVIFLHSSALSQLAKWKCGQVGRWTQGRHCSIHPLTPSLWFGWV